MKAPWNAQSIIFPSMNGRGDEGSFLGFFSI
jgi:hypothetical protein